MKSTAHGWTVIDGDRGVLSFEYEFAKGATANAITARLSDGSLLVMSPPSGVGDGVFKDLEAFGPVRALVALNGFHHLGLPAWGKAHPEAKLYAHEGAIPRITKKHAGLPALQSIDQLASKFTDEARVLKVPGMRHGELWLTAGPTWYLGDSYLNMQAVPAGVFGLLFKFTDSAPGFKVNGMQRALFVKDKPAYKRWVLEQLAAGGPKLAVSAHGALENGANIGERMRALVMARF